mmetsp:Transcript_32160/g.81954  ORF Transcript_32160/g.81954 Transcript_32160/m.81954 type:complete len:242 (-) Transcript_32160:1056-1781(-)
MGTLTPSPSLIPVTVSSESPRSPSRQGGLAAPLRNSSRFWRRPALAWSRWRGLRSEPRLPRTPWAQACPRSSGRCVGRQTRRGRSTISGWLPTTTQGSATTSTTSIPSLRSARRYSPPPADEPSRSSWEVGVSLPQTQQSTSDIASSMARSTTTAPRRATRSPSSTLLVRASRASPPLGSERATISWCSTPVASSPGCPTSPTPSTSPLPSCPVCFRSRLSPDRTPSSPSRVCTLVSTRQT